MGRRAGDFGGSCSHSPPALSPSSCLGHPTAGTCGCLHQPAKGQAQTAGLPGLSTKFLTVTRGHTAPFCRVTNNCQPQSHTQELLFQRPEKKGKREMTRSCALYSVASLGFQMEKQAPFPGIWLCFPSFCMFSGSCNLW